MPTLKIESEKNVRAIGGELMMLIKLKLKYVSFHCGNRNFAVEALTLLDAGETNIKGYSAQLREIVCVVPALSQTSGIAIELESERLLVVICNISGNLVLGIRLEIGAAHTDRCIKEIGYVAAEN